MGRSGLQYVQSIWKGGIPLEGTNMAQICDAVLPFLKLTFSPLKNQLEEEFPFGARPLFRGYSCSF